VLLTRAFTGLETNMLRPSIAAAGLDPDDLPSAARSTSPRTSTPPSATGPTARRWKDIWSAGHSVSGVADVPTGRRVGGTDGAEYQAASGPAVLRVARPCPATAVARVSRPGRAGRCSRVGVIMTSRDGIQTVGRGRSSAANAARSAADRPRLDAGCDPFQAGSLDLLQAPSIDELSPAQPRLAPSRTRLMLARVDHSARREFCHWLLIGNLPSVHQHRRRAAGGLWRNAQSVRMIY
jgi:hypothetical protein